MIEFGSDFHYIKSTVQPKQTFYDVFPSAILCADGRQAMIHLYKSQGWKRLWIPAYFCYDVIQTWKAAGLDLHFYNDVPTCQDDGRTLEGIQQKGWFRPNDAVLRVNYYGLRSYRPVGNLSVAAVVEDHTHDLLGGWARNSDADWCIASLRKTLPIPEGGIIWSPRGLKLPDNPKINEENEQVASLRWAAMKNKTGYLAGNDVEKEAFRTDFIHTEAYFDHAPVSSLDGASRTYLQTFDIKAWYDSKRANWNLLKDVREIGARLCYPEDSACYPFACVLSFSTESERNRVRRSLISRHIYPALLWNIPVPADEAISTFSRTMLSIHCDGRYTSVDMEQMKQIIKSLL